MPDTLKIWFQTKGCPRAMFRGDYDVADTLVEALDDYCLYHGLSAQCCQLFHDGKSLAKNKLLGQMTGLLSSDVLHVPGAWLAIAEAFSKCDEVVRVFTDDSLLTDMLSVKPSEQVSTSSTRMQSGLTEPLLKSAREAIQPLLLLLQLLQDAPEVPPLPAQMSPACSAKADEPAAQGSSQEIQCTDDSLAESARALGSPGDHIGNRAIQLMRVLIAVCKLASLMRAKIITSAADSTQQLFSRAIHFLLPDVMDGLGLHASGHADDLQEVERLCIRAVQVIMPGFGQTVKIIRQMTDRDPCTLELCKLDQSVTHEECCLSTFQMLLMSGHQQHRVVAANEMFRLGIVPLLLSCLEHTKGRPSQAFCVLSAVVADDKSKQAALAQMHGMLYVSKMLKPITVEQEASGPEYDRSLIDSIFTNNLRYTFEAVQLLQDLLSHDPFSRQPVTVSHSSCVQAALPAGASPSSPTGLRSTSAEKASVRQVVAPCATEARDQQSSWPEHVLTWHTPSAAAWSQIQTIACRASTCLHWAQSEVATVDQSQHSTLTLYNHLIYQLVMLLHGLLLGHVADPKLDLGPIFAAGLIPLMHQWKAWAPSSGPSLAKLTALGVAMLQRLASDASLTQLDECGPHWWALATGHFGRVHSIWELLEIMSFWEKRHTDSPEKGLLLPVIASAAIKALFSIPQLGLGGFHLDLHPAILTGFNAVITSHPSLATRLIACAVMAYAYYTGMVFARDFRQRGLLQDAEQSAPSCTTLVHQKDMVLSMYRIMQEALQVQQPWSQDHCEALTDAIDKAALFCAEAAADLPQPPQATLDLLWDVVKRLPDVSGIACTDMSRLSLLKAALSFLSAMRMFRKPANPQNLFTMGYYQWVMVQDKPTDLSSVEYLNGQRPVPSSGLFILQGLLDTESDGGFAVILREGGFGLWASMLVNLAQTALDDSLNKPRAAQMIDDSTKTYICLLPHYLELGCGKQDSEEVTRWDFAAAGLHFLAALLAHAAQMDTHAPADPESLATTEAANDSVTDACKDGVPKLLRKVQTHESKMRTRWKKRAQLVGNCIENIVERMEALRHANELWASAFSEAALDKSWWFGGTKTTSSKVHALLGLHFHKLLVNPGVMADWAQQSGVILTQAAQFFPELDGSKLYREALVETKVAGFQSALQENEEAAKKAAEVAGQQLLAEEEQQQARAAAKKAKKQRQKAKKAQPVSSVAEAVGSLDLGAEQAVDSSEQPSPSAASVPATSALLTDANMLQLFRCPITKAVMVDPVIAADGHTYERAAMQHWLQHHPTSPVTQALLPHSRLVPNLLIKVAIASQRQQLSQAAQH